MKQVNFQKINLQKSNDDKTDENTRNAEEIVNPLEKRDELLNKLRKLL